MSSHGETKTDSARAPINVAYKLSYKIGQKLDLALDWSASAFGAPLSGQCYVGPAPMDASKAWRHRKNPHLVQPDNKVLVLHVLGGHMPSEGAGTGTNPNTGGFLMVDVVTGSILIQATDDGGTTISTTIDVVQIDSDPCDPEPTPTPNPNPASNPM